MFLQQLLLAPLPWHGASSVHPLTPLHGLDAALGTSLRARRCWQGPSPPIYLHPVNLGLSHGPRAAGEQEWEPKDGDGQGEASENLNVIPSKLISRRRRQVLTELTTQLGRGIAHRGCDSQRDGWAGSWEGFPMPNSPGGSGTVPPASPGLGGSPKAAPPVPASRLQGLGLRVVMWFSKLFTTTIS